MESILATPASGGFNRPRSNGHRPGLLVEDLHPYEVQDSELISELEAELEGLLGADTSDDPAAGSGGEALLPGFEATTWADLDHAARSECSVGWCVHQGLPVHSDGFDPDPDHAPHRSVQHGITAIHGGESIDHAGRAEVSVQLEQDHDQESGPTVTLAVVVRGIEQYAWLTLPETRALRHALDHLLTEAAAEG